MLITDILARQILDSRGMPTVEVDVFTDEGAGRAAVPSGASTGSKEALEKRDGGQAYGGQGVSQAVNAILDIIKPVLIGHSADDQSGIDKKLQELDGTDSKSNLGANATLAVSLAAAIAAADSEHKPLYAYLQKYFSGADPKLPMPMCNVMNGGKHALLGSDIQEMMIVPISAKTFGHAMQIVVEVYQHLKKILAQKRLTTLLGDEGGFAPSLPSNRAALDLLMEAISGAGYQPGKDVALALDVAASELFDEQTKTYNFARDKQRYTTDGLIAWYAQLLDQYPIVSIEDGLDEADWDGWQIFTKQLGDRISLVGDDLLVTNQQFLQRAIDQHVANAVLIKPNQIGTLSETIATMKLAQRNSYKQIVSHRSGETEDVFIAHLAVASGCGLIKTGAPARGERTAKYNELIRIAEELNNQPLANPFV